MTISIIIPVYNTEAYIPACVESILSQSYSDFEVILIDDGSTDGSGVICDEYARRDCRVRVFHKENGGASSARNVGLDHAEGEWITFIDSDDWIENDYLLVPYEEDVDLIVRNWKYATGEIKHCLDPQLIDKDSFSEFLKSNIHLDSFRTACCSFFRRKIIDDHHIRFLESIRLGEDTLFVMDYYKFCSSVRILGDSFYIYNRQDNWGEKYLLSIDETLYFLSAFWPRYEELYLESDHFTNFIFSFFRRKTSIKSVREKMRWSLSKPVLNYKKSLLSQRGQSFRFRYNLSRVTAALLGRWF